MAEATVEEIVSNVYQITWRIQDTEHRSVRYRSYLFDFDDSVPTLVDTCIPEYTDTLIGGIETVGVDPERLVITHRHVDHAGGFEAIVDRYDVETWVPKDDDLVESEDIDVTTPADRLYTDGETIGRFEAVHVGGHTPGSSALVDEDSGIVACGDTLSGSDRRGLPKGYLIHPPQATNHGRPPEATVEGEKRLVELLNYEFDVALVHHGSSVFEGASEKLDQYVNYDPKPPFPEHGIE